MHAVTAGLIAAGILLALAAVLFARITRSYAAAEDRGILRVFARTGQGCTALALVALARYGYHPPMGAECFVYAAMAAAALAFYAWSPHREV